MVTKIQKWGNSQGLRIARQLLDDAEIAVGDEVEISLKEGVLVIAPVRRVRGRHDLQKLVARIPKKYRAAEVDWGKPAGKETW
ncbi:MAG TPA: AbrB/MazE/SpoVT family DNA-binding domain-containing protein [Candidatus Hydrogenedentes bacterium]|nr:AbrB/MazE/SpoVT family DNA-binding domain-containing protein [Candidatus Hydrogenedentota bacterium]